MRTSVSSRSAKTQRSRNLTTTRPGLATTCGQARTRTVGWAFAKPNISLTAVPLDTEPLELFLPCTIDQSLSLQAVWTREARSPTFRYIGQLWKFLQKHPRFFGFGSVNPAGRSQQQCLLGRMEPLVEPQRCGPAVERDGPGQPFSPRQQRTAGSGNGTHVLHAQKHRDAVSHRLCILVTAIAAKCHS